MMKYPKLSIIIPVYNTEKYLDRCLESVVNQSYKELEIIIVNDCSPGNVKSIVETYKEQDLRIKYVEHEKNKGLFRARLTGAQEATGEYIAFLDSDDYITKDYYHSLVRKATEKDADIVIGKTVLEKVDGQRVIQNLHDSCFEFDELKGDDIQKAFFGQKGLCYAWHTIWNKIYKKELWDKCFPHYNTITQHLIMTEDIAFSALLFYNAKKVATVKNDAYFYCENKDASTNVEKIKFTRFEKNINDIKLVFDFVAQYLASVNATQEIQDNFMEFRKHYSRLWRELGENAFLGYERNQAIKLMDDFLPGYKEYTTPDDHFFETITTKWNGGLEYIKEQIIQSSCQYISFDIFDTVIMRPLYNPTDLFLLMDKKFETLLKTNISFSKLRIQAEHNARYQMGYTHPSYQDVTIEEIYRQLEQDFNIPKELADEMLEEEKRLEIELCTTREATKEIYYLAQLIGKKIIFISDMYLDRQTIESILDKNGYRGYEKLYLSSEMRLTKNNGALFRAALNDLKVAGNEVLHIGDTWKNDITNAEAYGLQTIFLPKAIEVFENKIQAVSTNECSTIANKAMSIIQDGAKVKDSVGFRTMLALSVNKYFDNPYRSFNEQSDFNADPYFMGHYTLGMHLVGVASWLIEQGTKIQYDNILFMARDGYLPMKVYSEMAKLYEKVPTAKYLYVSRKSVLPAMLRCKNDFYDLPIEYRNHTPKTILSLLAFCTEDYVEEQFIAELKKNGMLYNKHFESEYEFNYFMKYYLAHLYSEQKHLRAIEKAKVYFKENIGSQDATFDLGYSGRIQGAVSNLVERPVDVFFIHQDAKRADAIKRKEGFNIFNFYDFTPHMTGLIREHLISDPGPSCIGFDLVDGKVVPKLEEEEKTYQDLFVISLIQKGVLDFARTYVSVFGKYHEYLGFKNQEVSLPYEGMIRSLKEVDRRIFKASYFEDLIYGAKDKINIYDFIQNQYMNLPTYQGTNNATYISHAEMVQAILGNRPKVVKAITYAVFDRKTLKEKVKGRLVNRPILLRSSKIIYKVIKKIVKKK